MRDRFLWLCAIVLIGAALLYVERVAGDGLFARLLGLTAIWSVAAVALNLTNGTAGVPNLGQHGFMLVGAYVTALLTSPKSATFLMAPWAQSLHLNWLSQSELVQMTAAVLVGGLVTAIFGLLVGIPSLRLRGDYLAMVTLGFGEAIRYVAATDQGSLLTNGGLGIRGIPGVFGSPFAAFVWLVIALWFFTRFTESSYGRALKSIREDELAAQAMGIHIAYHKVLAFSISAAFAGIAGGLYASWLRTIDPTTFPIFLMTYLLVAVSVGGVGSNTGAVLGTALVVLVRQYFQPLEREQSPGTLIGWAALAAAAFIFVVAVANGRRGCQREEGASKGLLSRRPSLRSARRHRRGACGRRCAVALVCAAAAIFRSTKRVFGPLSPRGDDLQAPWGTGAGRVWLGSAFGSTGERAERSRAEP